MCVGMSVPFSVFCENSFGKCLFTIRFYCVSFTGIHAMQLCMCCVSIFAFISCISNARFHCHTKMALKFEYNYNCKGINYIQLMFAPYLFASTHTVNRLESAFLASLLGNCYLLACNYAQFTLIYTPILAFQERTKRVQCFHRVYA